MSKPQRDTTNDAPRGSVPWAIAAATVNGGLRWDNRFPEDAAVRRNGVLWTDVDYLFETVLERGDASRDASAADRAVTVRYRVTAEGAAVRPAGGGDFRSEVESDPIRCSLSAGSTPFRVDVRAEAAGGVRLHLKLFVEGALTLARTVDLLAFDGGEPGGAT
jgi:hypothetical protein